MAVATATLVKNRSFRARPGRQEPLDPSHHRFRNETPYLFQQPSHAHPLVLRNGLIHEEPHDVIWEGERVTSPKRHQSLVVHEAEESRPAAVLRARGAEQATKQVAPTEVRPERGHRAIGEVAQLLGGLG
jgi:hypothetical protein